MDLLHTFLVVSACIQETLNLVDGVLYVADVRARPWRGNSGERRCYHCTSSRFDAGGYVPRGSMDDVCCACCSMNAGELVVGDFGELDLRRKRALGTCLLNDFCVESGLAVPRVGVGN